MADKGDKTLLNFLVDADLLKRIDDFRFKNRFPNRAAAIKWLLSWSLQQVPEGLDLSDEANR